ncbi:MAG: SMC-Scp complex subunit ScpB [Deltaproteobacteria bacterium]|nr:SMC-Scp complex subunit ScpB [Deltaproteobacteria bacterium]
MEQRELKPILEAMIFVSEEPIDEGRLAQALETEGVTRAEVAACLAELEAAWNENPERGLQLVAVAGGYQFRTKATWASWVQRLNVPKALRLSQPSLETVAIVAYQQPCTRAEIEAVRGVDCGGVLKTLFERCLVRVVGRRDEAGQPLLYGTTPLFLEVFHLNDLKELPPLKDIQELMRQQRVMTEEAPAATLAIGGGGDDEEDDEPTDVLEEDTEVIPEEDEDNVDEEALSALDRKMNEVRHLEHELLSGTLAGARREGDAQSPVASEGASEEAGTPGSATSNTPIDREAPAADRRVH